MGSAEATQLDDEEVSYLRNAFESADEGNRGRIKVEAALVCLEDMEFLIEGDIADLVRSVVPDAAEAGFLSFDELVKVASLAREQEAGAGDDLHEMPELVRDASLAALETSFHQQQELGGIPQLVEEGVPDTVEEAEEDTPSPQKVAEVPIPRHHGVFLSNPTESSTPQFRRRTIAVDVPHMRRSSIAVDVPQMRRGSVPVGAPSLAPLPGGVHRSESLMVFNSNQYANLEGPEPKPLDLPIRRGSQGTPAVPSNGGLMENVDSSASRSDRTKTGASSSALSAEARARQDSEDSEEELLESAMVIGPEPVEVSDIPVRRPSFISPEVMGGSLHLLEGAISSAELKELQEKAEAERALRARIKAEVESSMESMLASVERHCEILERAEEAERRAAQAAAELEQTADVKRRSEVEMVLSTLVDSLERSAAVAEATLQAERAAAETAAAAAAEAAARVAEEAAARLAAETRAHELSARVEEAMGLVAAAEEEVAKKVQAAEEVATSQREALRQAHEAAQEAWAEIEARARGHQEEIERQNALRAALEEETELLRSQLLETTQRAESRAREEEEAHAEALARAIEEGDARLQREAQSARDADERAELEVSARQEAEQEAREWREKFEAAGRELMEASQRAVNRAAEENEVHARALARAVEEGDVRVEREAQLLRDAQERAEEEAAARQRAQEEAREWRERCEAAAEREEIERIAAEEQKARLEAAIARITGKTKVASLENADVSYEEVDQGPWWRCLNCTTNPHLTLQTRVREMDEEDDEGYAAAVSRIKPESWRKLSRRDSSNSARGVHQHSRPETDVCVIM